MAQLRIARKMAARVKRFIPLPFQIRETFYRVGDHLALGGGLFSFSGASKVGRGTEHAPRTLRFAVSSFGVTCVVAVTAMVANEDGALKVRRYEVKIECRAAC